MDHALRPIRAICTLTALWLCGLNLAHAGGVAALAQPNWAQLTPQQQQVLAPLAAEWDGMESFRRKQWLGVAKRYEKMPPAEQARVQKRMRDWAKLTPEERKQARDKYKTVKKISPQQREALLRDWEDYKALPDMEKRHLKEQALRRPAISRLPPPPTKSGQRKIAPVAPGQGKAIGKRGPVL